MRKLLRANFARLWKDKCFWAVLLVMAGYGIVGCLFQYREVLNGKDGAYMYQIIFLNDYILNSVGFAAFANLFLGREYSDGTMRNKLVTGATRTNIYLSNYVTCVGAGIVMQLAYTLAVSILGIPMFGWNPDSLKAMSLYSCLGLLLICSEMAVFTLASMLCQNKAAVAVLCQIGVVAMLFVSMYVMSKLGLPEKIQQSVASGDGSYVLEWVENPYYISGSARKWYQFIQDILPVGQGLSIVQYGSAHPLLLALYSVVIAVVCNVAGILGFQRKDLK
ncbi:MAG TPA: ABC transporter permease [Candidatus Blautia faecipullorum]|nr:ABC transporter permease [Candidatus Blautia faecipullorum]